MNPLAAAGPDSESALDQAIRAAAQSHLRLALATQSARIGIWTWSVATGKLDWDARMHVLYGIPEHAFSGTLDGWRNCLHPQDLARAEAELADSLARAAPDFASEFRVVWPSGEIRHIEAHATVVRDGNGVPTQVVGANWDITARMQADAALRDSREQLRSIVDTAADGILIAETGIIGRLLSPNAAMCRLLGYTAAELRELTLRDVVDPRDGGHSLAEFERFATGSGVATGIALLRKDRNLVIADINCAPLTINGTPCLLGIFRDVTERRCAERALSESRARLDSIVSSAMDAIVTVDERQRIVLVNPAAERMFGYQAAELLGESLAVLLPARFRASHTRQVGEFGASGGASVRMGAGRTVYGLHKNGTEVAVEVSLSRQPGNAGQSNTAILRDVTERNAQERRIARLSRVRAVSIGISSAILRLRDRAALLQEACRVAAADGVFPLAMVLSPEASTGNFEVVASQGGDARSLDIALLRESIPADRRPSTLMARNLQRFVTNDLTADPVLAPLRDELVLRGYRSGAAFPLCVAGRLTAILVLLSGERDFFDAEEVELLDRLAGDLSFALEHIEQAQRLDHLAYYDSVTELANARLFHDRLEGMIDAARPEQNKVCVVALDLEGFTRFNEKFGRAQGDALLGLVGRRIEEFLIQPYALGRIGADTFVVASPRDQGRIATRLRDRVIEALQRPFIVDGGPVKIGAQLGIAFFPSDGADANAVFDCAEASLSHAKSSGERCSYYSSEINARIARRAAAEAELRAAVEASQFVLHYQPRVDLVSGELVGAEALIRWQHPRDGLTLPDRFIGLAEETGLIVPIGAWVIDSVCAQQAAWLAAGIDIVPTAVNVSSVQFRDRDLPRTVRAALADHRLDARQLELELTESAMMADVDNTLHVMSDLRRLGVGLALDDFGTGYSSLANLGRFPFNMVKIDRAFIGDMTQNAATAAIVRAIIGMGHSLKMKVVAEGVETQAQASLLRRQACDEIQGHFYETALPADRFAALLRARKRLALPPDDPMLANTLLLVDDEPGILAALNRLLRRDGYRILSAGSGPEALELLALSPVQVIVSDQRMPGMSGAEFLDIVKEMYPHTMRIILSGYTDLETVTDSVNRGAVLKFLTKPWEDGELRTVVREAFRRCVSLP